jgi:hypothetical protein
MGQKIKSIRTKYRSNINEKNAVLRTALKIPESAIATFLADDFNNADCAIRFNNLFYE